MVKAIVVDIDEPLTPQMCIQIGTIVKCGMKGKRDIIRYYLAKVIEVCEMEVQLKFLRREFKNVYTFPSVDDISWEPLAAITPIIPQPIHDKRQRYVFKDNDPLA